MTDVDDWRDYRDDDYEPSEPDFDAIAEEEHSRQVHAGGPCNCPVPTEAEQAALWEAEAEAHSEGFHGGGECDCEAPF